jgi:hypothetical protein
MKHRDNLTLTFTFYGLFNDVCISVYLTSSDRAISKYLIWKDMEEVGLRKN